jgi:hypothetical protein
MKVITVINEVTDFGFNLLRLSCALNNLELIVLVANGEFITNRIKDELLSDYLQEIDNNEIILFTDGNDAIFMANEDEILSKFLSTKSKLIFSAEVGCWPDPSLSYLYPKTSGPYKYLNSGGFMGEVGLIKEMLEDNDFDLEKFKKSNQYVWTKRYLRHQDKIIIDSNCDIFCTFSPQSDRDLELINDPEIYFSGLEKWFALNFSINRNRIFNKISNTWPCQAHFNGFSKWLLQKKIADILYDKIPGSNSFFYYEE